MLFQSSTLLAAMAGLATATKLSLQTYNVGAGTLDLGGASLSGSNGLLYKIDDGPWNELKNDADRAPCSYLCGDDNWSPGYPVEELGGNLIFVCVDGGSCVPGVKYGCNFRYGDIVVGPIDSNSDNEYWGVGNSVGEYCGGDGIFEVTL